MADPIQTFRRAMMRRIRRARARGLLGCVPLLQDLRVHPEDTEGLDFHLIAAEIRDETRVEDLDRAGRRYNMTLAFLYKRTADALDKLRRSAS